MLIIGTRPEDEDNALIAWLSLGRNVETAYLSLTRGESAVNLAGGERQAGLAVVRTAELLEERKRDGAHQYFTRAYDFGPTPSDSVVEAEWPHDVLLSDVAAVIRAFRPQVVISLFSDSLDADATHRVAGRLAREAYALAGDSIRLPAKSTSRLTAWSVSRLFARVDTLATAIAIDVGEFDRATGRSFAELGAENRRLHRTQLRTTRCAADRPGGRFPPTRQHARRESDDDDRRACSAASTRPRTFRDAVPAEARAQVDSPHIGSRAGPRLVLDPAPDSLAVARAGRAAYRAFGWRFAVGRCSRSGGGACSVTSQSRRATVGERAIRAMVSARGHLSSTGGVDRELVAAGISAGGLSACSTVGRAP